MNKFQDLPYMKEYSLKELPEISTLFIKMIQSDDCKVFGFKGDLGAGKTTLIKEIIRQLGVREVVKSPTYSIQCEYQGSIDGSPVTVHHWDLYRISELEAVEMYDEYLSGKTISERVLLVEWAERLGGKFSNLTQIEISELANLGDREVENLKGDFHERRVICIKCPKIDK